MRWVLSLSPPAFQELGEAPFTRLGLSLPVWKNRVSPCLICRLALFCEPLSDGCWRAGAGPCLMNPVLLTQQSQENQNASPLGLCRGLGIVL